MAIRFYSKSETHTEFSNFAPFGIELDGARWATVENFDQAQKFTDPALRKTVRKAEKPIIAKNLADKNKLGQILMRIRAELRGDDKDEPR